MCQTCQDSAGILVLERTRSEPSYAACRIHSPRPRRSHDERISSSLVIKYISNHHEIALNDPHHRRRGGKEVPRNYRQDNLRFVQRGFPPVGLGGHVSHLHTLPQTIPAEDDERQYPTRCEKFDTETLLFLTYSLATYPSPLGACSSRTRPYVGKWR